MTESAGAVGSTGLAARLTRLPLKMQTDQSKLVSQRRGNCRSCQRARALKLRMPTYGGLFGPTPGVRRRCFHPVWSDAAVTRVQACAVVNFALSLRGRLASFSSRRLEISGARLTLQMFEDLCDSALTLFLIISVASAADRLRSAFPSRSTVAVRFLSQARSGF